MSFEVYGLRLQCDFPLPELMDNEVGGVASVRVRRTSRGREEMRATPLSPITGPDGEPFAEVFALDDGYRLRFLDLVEFDIRRTGRDISYEPLIDLPRESLAHLLLDHVLPRVAQMRGALCLHATAVATPRGVHAFLAPTGFGKSTLIAALMEHDCAFVADDCLAIRERNSKLMVSPGYPGVRLYEDSRARLCPESQGVQVAHYTEKERVLAREMSTRRMSTPRPLRSVYVLERDDTPHEVRLTTLGEVQAATTVMANSFRMDPQDRSALERDLKMVALMLRTVAVRRLSLGCSFDALPLQCEQVMASLDDLPPLDGADSLY